MIKLVFQPLTVVSFNLRIDLVSLIVCISHDNPRNFKSQTSVSILSVSVVLYPLHSFV